MEDVEKILLERQIRLTPIHEAGHVIAARFCQMEIVSVDTHLRGNQCGLTRVVPMGADYSKSTGLPWDKEEAFTGFNRHNFELLAGPAAQAIYCYQHGVKTLNDFMPIQPEIWGILLEFCKDDSFFEFDEGKLTHGMSFFLTETGATGDWKTLLNHFKALPYDYFDELNTHDKRTTYLRQYWGGALKLLGEQWDKVISVSESLKREHELSGEQIESILAPTR